MFSPSETVLGEIADLSRGNGHSAVFREASICIIASVNWASYEILLPESGSGLILADSYRWFSRCGVMLKSKPETQLSTGSKGFEHGQDLKRNVCGPQLVSAASELQVGLCSLQATHARTRLHGRPTGRITPGSRDRPGEGGG